MSHSGVVHPQIQALVKECHRWENVQPAGVPHQSNADDVYRGKATLQ